MEHLASVIKTRIDISNDKLDYILAHFKSSEHKEQHFLLQLNEAADKLFFIESGAVRVGIISSDKEITRHLASTGSFVTCVSSFINQTPSAEFLQTTMATKVNAIDHKDMKRLMDEIPEWERLTRLLMQDYFLNCQQRINQLLTQNSENYYLHLLKHKPEILQSLPLYQVASYLGVEPQSLSRIRNKIAKK